MKIPSYDDLTPGISDVHPRDTFDQVTRLVPPDDEPVVASASAKATARQARTSHARGTSHLARRTSDVAPRTSHVFACLRARSEATAAALLSLARDFSPRIERYGPACVVLDVSGLGRLLGDSHGIAGELQHTAIDRGLKVRIAVAPAQIAARLLTVGPALGAATGPPLLNDVPAVVADDDLAAGLGPVPLEWLESLVESPARTFDALRRWGLRKVGEFAALPADELAARFGPEGLAIHRLACGIDPRPLIADPGIPRFVQSMELEWPIETLEPLSFVLARLLDPLSAALERADRAAAAIRLDLRLVDKTTHARMLQLPAPIRDPRVLRTLLALDLESHAPHAGIDVVTIEVDPAPSRIVQFSLLERATPSAETLATLTARLNALVGDDRCGAAALVDSHRPDAFELRRFDPDAVKPGRRDGVPPPAGTVAPLTVTPLRRFRPPIAVRVGIDRGRPSHVAVDRRGMPGGRVEQSAGPWRSSGAWWHGDGSHWDRDEWDVELSDGVVCRLCFDRHTGIWFIDGVVD